MAHFVQLLVYTGPLIPVHHVSAIFRPTYANTKLINVGFVRARTAVKKENSYLKFNCSESRNFR
jgi:hypothetical protein